MLAKPGDILQNLGLFYFTSSPPPPICSIKETSIQTHKMVPKDYSLPSSQMPGFPNQATSPCLNTSFPDDWPAAQRADRAWTQEQ